MFINRGDFIFPGGSFELSSVDECFLDSFVEDFFEKNLLSSSIEECNVESIRRRNFTLKRRGSSFRKVIINKVCVESSDKVNLYPKSPLSSAHKLTVDSNI